MTPNSHTTRMQSVRVILVVFVVMLALSGVSSIVSAQELDFTTSETTASQSAESVNVSVTITNSNSETIYAPAVGLTGLPSNWSISNVTADNGTVEETQTRILYLKISENSSKTPVWTLQLPANVSAGDYNLSVNIIRNGSTTNSIDVRVKIQNVTAPPPVVGNTRPKDPDGDGKFQDINGDGTTNVIDVGALLAQRESAVVQNNSEAFDFNDDGRVNIIDVGDLLSQIF